jgi:hypothetical protein
MTVRRTGANRVLRRSSSAPFRTLRLNRQHTKAFAGNLGVTLGSGDQNHAVTLLSIPGIAISGIEGIRYQPETHLGEVPILSVRSASHGIANHLLPRPTSGFATSSRCSPRTTERPNRLSKPLFIRASDRHPANGGEPIWDRSRSHLKLGRVLICGRPARCKRFLKSIGA